jgi:predicted methyltransferase
MIGLSTRSSAATFWTALTLASVFSGLLASVPAASPDLTLYAAVNNPARSVRFLARDKARHPLEELTFFGVEPQSTVVEIWPGGGYWTEILAPLLHEDGVYYVALQGKGGSAAADDEAEKLNSIFRNKIEADQASYGKVITTALGIGQYEVAPAGSADFVLSFRNLHNWLEEGDAAEALADSSGR